MMRLRLLIADRDKAYVESLIGFLTDKYPQKFKVSFFTDKKHLADFLLKGSEKADILLISPEFYEDLKSLYPGFNADYKKFNTNCQKLDDNCHEFNSSCYKFNSNCHETNLSSNKFTANHYQFNTNSDESSNDSFEFNVEEYKVGVPVIILLVGSDTSHKPCNFNTIYKYQHGDKLVSDIIGIYESKSGNLGSSLKHAGNYAGYAEAKETDKASKTCLISVYSPAGGAGKTTIAVSSCIQCAREGMKVFYFNLESISSEPCFFECNLDDESRDNFSSVILAAKEKNKSLHAKIQGIKLIDAEHSIHYLLPPDSALEMEEILPDEIRYILQEIISTGYYDIIFADLDSSLNPRTLALMEESDNVILVHTPEPVSRQKILSFYRELGIYGQVKGVNLQEKMVLAVNRYDENIPEEVKNDIDAICTTMGIDCYFKIPVSNQAASYRDEGLGLYGRGRAWELDGFSRDLRRLVGKCVKGRYDHAKSCR